VQAGDTDKTDTSRLIFRGDYNYPPLEFLNEKGESAGFTVELMDAVAEVMGLNITIDLGPWYVVKENLRSGKTDGLIAMYFSKERNVEYDFGDPYLYMYHSLFIEKNHKFKTIGDLSKLERPTVILQNSSFLQQFILSYNPNTQFIIVDTQVEALRLLASNQYNFALLPKLQGLYLIDKYKLTNIKRVDQDLLPRGYGFAVKKGDSALLAQLNQGLSIIKATGKFEVIYKKWFGHYEEASFKSIFYKYLLFPIIGAVSVIVIALIVIFFLRRKVYEKTRLLNIELEERKKTQLQLEVEKDRAQESDRLKSAFLANMSHEIRTPMNAILGFANLLGEPDISPDEQKEYTELINLNSKALLELINDIIDIAKIEAHQLRISKESFELNRFLKELFKIFSGQLKTLQKENIELRLSIPENISELNIKSDIFRLRQIVNNLLGNALKFTNKGFIEYGYTTDKDILQFYVKDTGIGISEDKKDLIFSRFRQVDESHTREYGGTGLGLSISSGLIKLLGGDIWLDSISGKGSVFYFTLPIEEASITLDKKPVVFETKSLKNKKILVAEDVIHNFYLVQSMLKNEGAELVYAENGLIAKNLFEEQQDFDLVLLDIRMPIMDGFAAFEHIHKMNNKIPIIAVTAYAMVEDKKRIKDIGFTDYITKPMNKQVLLQTLSKYV